MRLKKKKKRMCALSPCFRRAPTFASPCAHTHAPAPPGQAVQIRYRRAQGQGGKEAGGGGGVHRARAARARPPAAANLGRVGGGRGSGGPALSLAPRLSVDHLSTLAFLGGENRAHTARPPARVPPPHTHIGVHTSQSPPLPLLSPPPSSHTHTHKKKMTFIPLGDGTTFIAVDRWGAAPACRADGEARFRPGTVAARLLSHAHADHTAGLDDGWARDGAGSTIYASPATAGFLAAKWPALAARAFRPLRPGDELRLFSRSGKRGRDGEAKEEGAPPPPRVLLASVHALDANHCPVRWKRASANSSRDRRGERRRVFFFVRPFPCTPTPISLSLSLPLRAPSCSSSSSPAAAPTCTRGTAAWRRPPCAGWWGGRAAR